MSVKLLNKGNIQYLKIDGFEDEHIDHAFSTRNGWDQEDIFSSMRDVLQVEEDSIYKCKQVHGKKVLIVDESTSPSDIELVQADGLVTNVRGIVLCTYHADCTPIYFYDRNKQVVGSVHAGWRGTLENIVKEIVDVMETTYACDVKDIKLGIGPAICSNCYEVKEDVYSKFLDVYGEEVLRFEDDLVFLDTARANVINAIRCGIPRENIVESNFCTSCNEEILYSYRRDNKSKNRMITGIKLRPSK